MLQRPHRIFLDDADLDIPTRLREYKQPIAPKHSYREWQQKRRERTVTILLLVGALVFLIVQALVKMALYPELFTGVAGK